jgi:flagellar FliL protein
VSETTDIIVEEEEGAPAPPPKPKSRKKLIVIGAAAAVLLLGGGGGAYMMLGGPASEAAAGEHEEAAAESEGGHGEGAPAFVDVPPMVVNLRSPDGATRFLKLHFVLVPGKKTSEELTAELPLLLDAYQPFLRELRPEDLAGSAAVFRIKEEMLRRSAERLGPGAVKDILIQDLVQQ